MVETRRRGIDELRGAFEGSRMTHLEAAGEIELADLLAHGLDDLRPAMTGIDAPQPGRAVEHAVPIRRGVIHAFGAHEQARRLLILAVRREGHPKGFEIVRGKLRVHVGPKIRDGQIPKELNRPGHGFGEACLEDIHAFAHDGIARGERRKEANDVAVSAAG